MLVSVIIPNYCHAKFLDQRIQSVLNQTYQDFEIIILDDCSPDDGASRMVIEKYRDNPHVSHIVYSEANSGSTFKQWNKGFELAVGELIWIAESDDYCEACFLESIIRCWENHPDCSIVMSATHGVNAMGELLYPNVPFSDQIIYSEGKEFIKRNMIYSCHCIPNASAVTFKKNIALGLPDDYISYKAAGDRLFWIYMLERGNICKIDSPLNFFRKHDNKVSPRKEADGTQSRENFKINQYIRKQGYINGVNNAVEFISYWNYLHTFSFESESIRDSLLKLWFPRKFLGLLPNHLLLFYYKIYRRILG